VADWLEDHPQLPAWRADLLRLIWQTPHLDWLLLSKRPENWADMLHAVVQSEDDGVDWWASRWLDGEYPPNVWMGTSVEDQANADVRIPALLEIPAAIHFLSVEPLLGPVDIASMGIYFTNPDGGGGGYALYPLTGETWFGFGEEPDFGNLIDWLIVGGESGPQARPMHPDWVRSIRDQCRDAGTAFFFKQWGEWGISTLNALGATPKRTLHRFEDGVVMEKVGKHKAGRFLDGRTWGEFPVVEFTTEEVSNV
jgi:protein gp37